MTRKNYTAFSVRNLQLGAGQPAVCVPLVGKNREDIKEQLDQIKAGPHDLVEWRADYLDGGTRPDNVLNMLQSIRGSLGDTALLFTFRTKPEGGNMEITPEAYRTLCLSAANSGLIDLIDVEYHMGEEILTDLIPAIQSTGTGVICSCHDFQKTPGHEEILQTLCQMQSLGADITKMAVMPQSRSDVLELLLASVAMDEQYADRPFITMSMGRLGALSRLAGYLDGSAVTFAAAGRASAPGQMSADGVSSALKLLA